MKYNKNWYYKGIRECDKKNGIHLYFNLFDEEFEKLLANGCDDCQLVMYWERVRER